MRNGTKHKETASLPDGTPINRPGMRVFAVALQGKTVLTDADPLAMAGARNVAAARTFQTEVTGGQLVVGFVRKIGEPLLHALEIEQLPPLPDPPPGKKKRAFVLRVNCGVDPADHAACPPDQLAARIAEVCDLRDCWLGDFHALAPITVDETRWMAWQLNRPDLGRGFALAFRRPQAGNPTMWSPGLRDLDPHGLYCVRHHDAGWIREMTGAELASLSVTLPQPGSCALISYRAWARAASSVWSRPFRGRGRRRRHG